MKISEFKLMADDFGTFGRGLQRPECVWIDRDGIWVSDARGGLARVNEDSDPTLLGSGVEDANGFSRRPDGSFVVAGLTDGGLHVIAPDGQTRKILSNRDGTLVGAPNYACADGQDRIWLSVMTRKLPWHGALQSPNVDGYILRVDDGGARYEIVADGLDLTNEVKLSPDGRHLYAVETFGCRIVRFPIRSDGSLGPKEPVGPDSLGRCALPDGITFDPFGNLWITMIVQNGLYVIDRHGEAHVVFQDVNERAVATLADGIAHRNGVIDHLGACAEVGGPLKLPTSLAFGGPGGRTAYVGSVAMPHLATFQLPDGLE
jgi:sugar lactone lactonase YvrE